MPTAYMGKTTDIMPFPAPVVVAACFFISAAALRPGWGPGCSKKKNNDSYYNCYNIHTKFILINDQCLT